MQHKWCRRHADVTEHGYRKKIKVFVEIEKEFIQILIKMHLVMCLAPNKRPFTKERKKEEEMKNATIRGCFEKNIMKSVNSCKFKIVYKHCLCLL